MTQNQIAYQNMIENRRANRAKEAENYRSNVAKENISSKEISEKERANRATEKLSDTRNDIEAAQTAIRGLSTLWDMINVF